eukprot:1773816-Alexandrium_andersonii.AAC.1
MPCTQRHQQEQQQSQHLHISTSSSSSSSNRINSAASIPHQQHCPSPGSAGGDSDDGHSGHGVSSRQHQQEQQPQVARQGMDTAGRECVSTDGGCLALQVAGLSPASVPPAARTADALWERRDFRRRWAIRVLANLELEDRIDLLAAALDPVSDSEEDRGGAATHAASHSPAGPRDMAAVRLQCAYRAHRLRWGVEQAVVDLQLARWEAFVPSVRQWAPSMWRDHQLRRLGYRLRRTPPQQYRVGALCAAAGARASPNLSPAEEAL